jgi:hypothetical protein
MRERREEDKASKERNLSRYESIGQVILPPPSEKEIKLNIIMRKIGI